MRAQGQPLHDVSEQVVKVELERIQFQASRFDLGEVEDLVDDRKQGFGGELHRGEVFALFRSEVGFQSEFGHADDAVHGGADLVAHIGEESALGTTGSAGLGGGCMRPFSLQCELTVQSPGFLQRLAQLLFLCFLRGDVHEGFQKAFPAIQKHRHDGLKDGDQITASVEQAAFRVVYDLTAIGNWTLALFGRTDKAMTLTANDLFPGLADESAGGRVDSEDLVGHCVDHQYAALHPVPSGLHRMFAADRLRADQLLFFTPHATISSRNVVSVFRVPHGARIRPPSSETNSPYIKSHRQF